MKIIPTFTVNQLWPLLALAKGSTTRVSKTNVTDSIFNMKISETQREFEGTPSEPILPPQPSGEFEVDESVRACEV